MAVVSCAQIGPGRKADYADDFNAVYTVLFRVIVSDPYDAGATVINASDPVTGVSIPNRWDQYIDFENTDDPWALCVSAVPKQEGKSWASWIVECLFKTNFQIQMQEDPEDDPTLTWIEVENERRPVTQEYDGTPIINSAGQLYSGVEADFAVYTYCWLRNEPQITPFLNSYNCTKNSDQFFGMAPGQGLLKIYIDKPQRRQSYFFFPHTYKVKFNPLTWDVDPIDQGSGVLGSDGKLTTPVDSKNEKIDPPYNLDGSGKLLTSGPLIYLSGINIPTSLGGSIPNPNGAKKQVYAPMPFSVLNLDQNIAGGD